MLRLLRRRYQLELADTESPADSRPMRPPAEWLDQPDGLTVSELSELEARALCAREGIAVFWPRPDRSISEPDPEPQRN
jgi:hypothetical protein